VNISYQDTRNRLRDDRHRLHEVAKDDPRKGGLLLFNLSYQAAWLHRWSHYFFCRGNRQLARLLWHLNLWLTGADISPISDIGGGLLLLYPLCVILVGKIGRNFTAYGQVGVGGGMSSADIGAGPGLPVLGDNVTLDFGALVLGPVHVHDNARVGGRCVVTGDVPEGATVEGRKPRLRQQHAEIAEAQHG
jgi:serine O-acetyltransferase